ncbi:PPOX class F420-dependent oxidoreductase [Pseudonocardia asaccharolytica]|nr:PPOX class F420-dependent oxidoreductase [Pseudonocardia asaccharolytica]
MTTTVFTSAELGYLREQPLGRLATLGPDGSPQVRPVGFYIDEQTGTIDVGGLDNPSTQKWRNVSRDGRVSLVVDDLASTNPWRPRAVEIRGVAELLPDARPAGAFPGIAPGVIRIHPRRVLSFGIDSVSA